MSKNTKILLIISIIIFVLSIGIFTFLTINATDKDKTKQNQANLNKSEEFIFSDTEGNNSKIDTETELGIAIVFWSSDTAKSLETLDLIDAYYELYKDSIDFYIINTQEKNTNIIELVENCNFTFPVHYDYENKASNFYNIEELPTLVFIDKNNEIHTINNGIDEDTLTANLDILAENY